MFRTLYSKLAGVLLGLFCLLGVLYIALNFFTTRLYLREVNQELNRKLAQTIASEKILLQEGRINEKDLKDVFMMLMVVNPGIELYLLDADGNILTYSAPSGKVKRERVALGPLTKFIDDAHRYPILGDDPRDPAGRKIFSAARIVSDGKIEGYLYIILGGEEYDSVAQMLRTSYILRLSLWIVGLGFLFALLTGLILFKQMTQRLRQLTQEVEAFKGHDFSKYPDEPVESDLLRGDEISRLKSVFRQMAGRIRDQMAKLKATDANRRELLANLSHDLRTPLASLQGYLETLQMREDRLSAEEKREFLSTALKLNEQIAKLISELLELAKLESPDLKLSCESLSISELVHDVVLKFKIEAERRDIAIEVESGNDNLFAWADLRLTERVLENLIRNATEFSRDGATVTVGLFQEAKRIAVEVRDTGCGIPRDELPRIFERFYWKKRRGERGAGTGLGLAIAKRIVELHGSALEVESNVNAGTIFRFALPRSEPGLE